MNSHTNFNRRQELGVRVSKSFYMQRLAFVVNLTQLRVTLEGSLSERLSTLGWPVDLSIGIVLWRPSLLWTVLFPRQGALSRPREEKLSWVPTRKQISKHVFISICSGLWMWCASLKFLSWLLQNGGMKAGITSFLSQQVALFQDTLSQHYEWNYTTYGSSQLPAV